MPRTGIDNFVEEAQKREVSSINLYTIQFDPADSGTWKRYAERDQDITFDSQVYQKSSIRIEETESKKDGSLTKSTLIVPDVDGTVWGYVLAAQAAGTLKKVRISRKVVWANRLDEPTSYIEDEFEATSAAKAWPSVRVTLQNPLLFEDVLPRAAYMKNRCRHVFKDSRCKYAGAESACEGTLKACEDYSNEANFGGFPMMKRMHQE